MQDILLINPNSSASTTEMMVEIAAGEVSAGFQVKGATARTGPTMIVTEAELLAAAFEVQRVWQAAGPGWAGVIISAFGDPGIDLVRAASAVPVVGICEASMLEAGAGGRRFGVATVTPELAVPIDRRAYNLGLSSIYTGIRLTDGEPRALATDPRALEEALALAVQRCIDEDGAEAVIIGGGPLGQAAIALASRFSVPIIAPIPAAVRLLRARIKRGAASTPQGVAA